MGKLGGGNAGGRGGKGGSGLTCQNPELPVTSPGVSSSISKDTTPSPPPPPVPPAGKTLDFPSWTPSLSFKTYFEIFQTKQFKEQWTPIPIINLPIALKVIPRRTCPGLPLSDLSRPVFLPPPQKQSFCWLSCLFSNVLLYNIWPWLYSFKH